MLARLVSLVAPDAALASIGQTERHRAPEVDVQWRSDMLTDVWSGADAETDERAAAALRLALAPDPLDVLRCLEEGHQWTELRRWDGHAVARWCDRCGDSETVENPA